MPKKASWTVVSVDLHGVDLHVLPVLQWRSSLKISIKFPINLSSCSKLREVKFFQLFSGPIKCKMCDLPLKYSVSLENTSQYRRQRCSNVHFTGTLNCSEFVSVLSGRHGLFGIPISAELWQLFHLERQHHHQKPHHVITAIKLQHGRYRGRGQRSCHLFDR